MTVCVSPDISFTAGSVALLVQFVIQQDDGSGTLVPIPDASTATVTWVSPTGQRRPLTVITTVSAVFGWVTSAQEFTSPRIEVGRCLVSTVSGGVFWTQPFTIAVHPIF